MFPVLNLTRCAGTDHPFFPPLENEGSEWLSVTLNSKSIHSALKDDLKAAKAIMGDNAVRILRLGD